MRRLARVRFALTRAFLRLTVPGLVLDSKGRQRIHYGASLCTSDGGRLRLGKEIDIARGAQITVNRGVVSIGDGSFIGPWTTIVARTSLQIGNDCLIAERVSIRDQDHEIYGEFETPIIFAGFRSSPVVICDGVWICAGAVILKGVTVGQGAVVAANAVVTHDVRPGAIVGGVPAREIGMRRNVGS